MAYVYSHIRKDNSKCFYIGKGKGNRAFETASRNPYWQNVAAKGYDVIFLVSSISDSKALELERDFISQIGLENLTNLKDGGAGGFTEENRAKAYTLEANEKRSKGVSAALKGRPFHGDQFVGIGKQNGRYGSGNLYKELTTGFIGRSYDMIQKFGNKAQSYNLIYSHNRNKPFTRGAMKGLQFKIISND